MKTVMALFIIFVLNFEKKRNSQLCRILLKSFIKIKTQIKYGLLQKLYNAQSTM